MEETIEHDDTSIDRDNSDNKRHREETFPGEEWLIIEEGEDGKNLTSSQSVERDNGSSSSEMSYSDIDYSSDAEEAREMPLPVLSEEAVQVGEADELETTRKDESDGASMTMESTSRDNEIDPILSSENVALQIAPKRTRENIFKEVATSLNLLIACSMVIAIGIGLGLKWHELHRISQPVDYATIKIENDRLLEQIKQITSAANEILDEIKPAIIGPKIIKTSEFQRPTKDPVEASAYPKKRSRAQHRSPYHPLDVTLFERLQNPLSTICSILEHVKQSETTTFASPSSCDTRSTFSDLSALRGLLDNVITEMDDSTKSINHKFLTNIEFQIDSVRESFVFELARSLDKANAKTEKKVGKIVEKVNERLCMLRNTMSSDNKLKLFLDANNTLLENCEKIASRKLNEGMKEKSSRLERGENYKPRANNSQSSDSYKISESYASRLQNATMGAQVKPACRQSAWQTRKCCNNDLTDGIPRGSQDKEETCSALLAPPRSTWKAIKRPTPPEFSASRNTDKSKNDKAVRRKESTTKGSFRRLRPKGDGAPSERAKIKNTRISMGDQKHDECKKRKPSTSKQPSSSRSFSTSVSRNVNEDIEYERIYPAERTTRRMKKRLGRANNEEKRREREKLTNGDWQFARSRFRDQLRRTDESTENWYFNRAGNRKFSRSNRNRETKQEPR